jgi:hypothetical protein
MSDITNNMRRPHKDHTSYGWADRSVAQGFLLRNEEDLEPKVEQAAPMT